MGVPHRWFLLISLSLTLLITRYNPTLLLLGSKWCTVITTQVALTLSFLTWTVIIYPKLFSPLRHLPQPKGGSFINGHFWKIFKEPTGLPHREWMDSVPNDGLIYYTSFMNAPRVFVTSPEGLKEVLASKSYEFTKPGMISQGIGRILGIGILFAEGDEHRVSCLKCYSRCARLTASASTQSTHACFLLPPY